MKTYSSRVARAFAGLAVIIANTLSAHAEIPLELNIEEGGQARSFELAADEVEVTQRGEQPTGRLRQLVETKLAGSRVIDGSAARVVVQFPRAYNRNLAVLRSEKIDLAVPDAEMAPVFYLKGAPRDKWSRRMGSKSVLVFLKEGETPEQARNGAGAASVRETSIHGVAVLRFASPFLAAEAGKRLEGQGVRHRPLLRQFMQKMAVPPQDQFFQEQWHLANTGQRNAVVGVDINVLPAWDVTLGNGITITIVDDCLQTLHPDLTSNCPPVATKLHRDFNDDDDDPKPINSNGDFHGTCVGGLAAARQNNGSPDPTTGLLLGVSGVAPEARLLGLRLIAGAFNDEDIADALTWSPNNTQVDVSNNSWGIPDVYGLGGFDILAKAAQRDAAVKGRDGKGQVTVFSAGNGRFDQSNANYSSIANSRFVLTVGALDSTGKFSSYSEPGAPILVTAPGGGLGFLGNEQRCVTTDVTGIGGLNPAAGDVNNTDYTRQMNGTSSAAPITSGVVALMLASNPALTWRDVKEILAGTARRIDETAADWVVRPLETGNARLFNGGGFKFNHDYGSGLVDSYAAVVRGQTWTNLAPEVSQSSARKEPGATGTNIPDDGATKLIRDFDFTGVNFPNLRVEQIEVEVFITHRHRSDLEIVVISPSGVRSVLAQQHFRPFGGLDSDTDYRDIVLDFNTRILTPRSGGWVFSTTHHWGENSTGKWTIEVLDRIPGTGGKLVSSAVRLYGTAAGAQRVMFDQQLYSVTEPGSPQAGTFSQTDSEITITAVGHNVAVGNPVQLTFSNGVPSAPTNGTFAVVTTTPGASFTVTAADSVARTGDVILKPVVNQAVTVRRLGGTTDSFTVNYQTTVSTATAGQDYLVATGTLTFADGDVTKEILIPILADTAPEVTEAVQLVLTNPVGTGTASGIAFGGNTLARIGIVDDEINLVKVEATDSEAGERSTEVTADPGVFTITRSKVSPQPLDVFFTLGGSAVPGVGPGGDYNPLPNNGGIYVATIPAFQMTIEVVIQPREDAAIEGTENVVLQLQTSLAYQLGVPVSAEVIIVDNDRPKVQMTLLDNLANETFATSGDAASFLIRRNLVDSKPLIVFLNYGGTQILGTNYLLKYAGPDGQTRTLADPLVGNTIEIGPNQTDVTVTLEPINDTFYQATKTVDIAIQPRPDYDFNFGFLTSVHLNIVENDPFPDIRIPAIAISTPRANEVIDAPEPVTFSGRAGDNRKVARVLYRLNGGSYQNIAGLVPDTVNPLAVRWSIPINYVVSQGDITAGISVINGLAATTNIVAGMLVEAVGIPPGATVVSVAANSVTVDKQATGTATTTIRFSNLTLGSNVIEAFAIDEDGNSSRLTSVLFDYRQLRTLTVTVNGPGVVSRGFVPTSTREAGKVVRINAVASAGQVFNGWTGVADSTQRALAFVMPNADSTLTANFVPSPFVREIAGYYSGLVRVPAPAAFAVETSGFLRVNVSATGVFTGQLVLAGVTYPLHGEFTGSGQYVGEIRRVNSFPITLNFTIDVNPAGTQRIVGSISANSFVTTVIANRAAYSATNPVPSGPNSIVGRYTLLLPPASPIGDALRDPRGNGIGTVAVGSDGTVYLRATLPDGTRMVQRQPLSRDNTWPVFSNLYNNRGVLVGLVAIDHSRPGSDLAGKFDWSKPVVSKDRYFPLGFRIVNADLLGSTFRAPALGSPALNFPNPPNNGVLTLQEGSLLNDIVRTMTYSAANRISITNPGAERIILTVDPQTGFLSGTFTHPVSRASTPLSGVIFDKLNIAVGRFQGSSVPGERPQTGRLLIEQAPLVGP